MINNSRSLNDLLVPPANRLEALRGKRAGQHSVRINDQWRICFHWSEGDARYFGTPEEFWMGLQADYDLEKARNKLGNRLIDEVSTHAA